MASKASRRNGGFTLIEVAVVLGVLGILLLVTMMLLAGSMNAYAKISMETETVKKARHCLETISRDARESVNLSILNDPTADVNDPMDDHVDALLLWSAREAINNNFVVDSLIDYSPTPQSIILYYMNTSAEGIPQLMRHQLYHAQDLIAFVGPFTILSVPDPSVGSNIVIADIVGTPINIDPTTGAINGVAPFKAPQVMMIGSTSLEIIDADPNNPMEARITCRFTDQYGRSTTTRLRTQIELRNM